MEQIKIHYRSIDTILKHEIVYGKRTTREKIGIHEHLPYDPERKITIIISPDVKRRLMELKTKYRLKSFNETIELVLNEKEKR